MFIISKTAKFDSMHGLPKIFFGDAKRSRRYDFFSRRDSADICDLFFFSNQSGRSQLYATEHKTRSFPFSLKKESTHRVGPTYDKMQGGRFKFYSPINGILEKNYGNYSSKGVPKLKLMHRSSQSRPQALSPLKYYNSLPVMLHATTREISNIQIGKDKIVKERSFFEFQLNTKNAITSSRCVRYKAQSKRYTQLLLHENVRDQKCRLLTVSSFRCGTVVPFKLSDIGEGIRDVTIKEWFVKPGDRVSQFDNICEVQSDKASVTITSRYDGLIKALHYKVDEVALIGESLLDIELDDNGNADVEGVGVEPQTVAKNENETVSDEGKQATRNGVEKALATPAVRRIAMENNINLKDVIPTGKDGRVLKEDILDHLDKISARSAEKRVEEKPTAGKAVSIKGYSKHMWKTMTQSLSIPHFVYSDECTVNKLMDYRNDVKDSLKEQGVSLTLMPFFVKAASRALEEMPQLNAWLDEENQTIRVMESHNIGIAMDTPEGLVVPNIKNVQKLSILEIAKELNRLQELGKRAAIPLSDLTDTTFSLSNIGVVGGTYTKPVILPPQIVIGAFGKVQKVPRFDDKGNVIAASVISISWAADHRVVDGVTMAKYSNFWKHYVENPTYLLIGA
ncbi:dihydrolipoamide branched chain transacylase E2 [Calliopsis andreniformis]|uniref:dihydrolipoamide branched chain transacylase E2 n=1 Tax=Calliopsis andreniformis TaxID=337506 RepID=UPI003FCE4884